MQETEEERGEEKEAAIRQSRRSPRKSSETGLEKRKLDEVEVQQPKTRNAGKNAAQDTILKRGAVFAILEEFKPG